MAIYVECLVVEVSPTLKTSSGVIRDGSVPVADVLVVLIPHWNYFIGKKFVMAPAVAANPSFGG